MLELVAYPPLTCGQDLFYVCDEKIDIVSYSADCFTYRLRAVAGFTEPISPRGLDIINPPIDCIMDKVAEEANQ